MAEVFQAPSWVEGKYDTIVIDGRTIGPPYATIRLRGFKRDLRIEHKKGSGEDGGDVHLRGLELAKGAVEVRIWDKSGEELMQALVPVFLPQKQPKDRAAVNVQHPLLAKLGITRVVVQSIEPQHPGQDGTQVWVISLWEKRKGAQTASGKPKDKPSPSLIPTIEVKGGAKAPSLVESQGKRRPEADVSVR